MGNTFLKIIDKPPVLLGLPGTGVSRFGVASLFVGVATIGIMRVEPEMLITMNKKNV